jgi:hypothetical protein
VTSEGILKKSIMGLSFKKKKRMPSTLCMGGSAHGGQDFQGFFPLLWKTAHQYLRTNAVYILWILGKTKWTVDCGKIQIRGNGSGGFQCITHALKHSLFAMAITFYLVDSSFKAMDLVSYFKFLFFSCCLVVLGFKI